MNQNKMTLVILPFLRLPAATLYVFHKWYGPGEAGVTYLLIRSPLDTDFTRMIILDAIF